MHVLGADMLTVAALQDFEHLAERAELKSKRPAEIDLAIIVGLGEAVGSGPELRMLLARRQIERIKLGEEMAAGAEVADQHAGAQRILRRGKCLLFGEFGRRQHGRLEPI